MKSLRLFYQVGIIDHRLEFIFLLSWALFFPLKESLVYFLGFSSLLCLILARDIYVQKTIGLSYFSHFLAIFNFILMLSVFFSNYRYKSILLVADIFLISCYFLLFYYDRRDKAWYFHLLVYIISIFSTITIILYVFPPGGQRYIFFISAIHEGIICGMGILILVYYLLKKWRPLLFALLIPNIGGLFVSQSKAAYIGTVGFTLIMVISKKRSATATQKERSGIPGKDGRNEDKDGFFYAHLRSINKKTIIIPFLILFVILTFLIPNPIRAMFHHSIKKDPYALERLNIWKMSLAIFIDHPLIGVGLDNFREVSSQYTFKQIHGPANYFKLPNLPHSDYMKLLTELGMVGLLIIFALCCALVRKFLSPPFPGISGILVLYLLFQALLFNIIFNAFFLFVFLFLLKDIFEQEKSISFRSFSVKFKLFISSLLLCAWLVGYFLPWLAGVYIEKSKKSANLADSFNFLKKAEYLNPLDQDVYYLKARLLAEYFKGSANLESFQAALDNIHTSQRLNRRSQKAYILEFELFKETLSKKIGVTSLEEILAPLERAEVISPVNPFIKLNKAQCYLRFDQRDRAREEALRALALEPEYAAALFFLQRNFNYFQDPEVFRQKMEKLSDKARSLQPKPGSYLYKLYQLPEQYKQERNDP